jgi:RNA-binding protein YlmH
MIKDKAKYLDHINDTDQIITMRKILDKIEKAMDSHTVEYTDFLDPYQRRLSYSILNRFKEIEYVEYGGYEDAERKSIIIYPFYMDSSYIDNPIGLIEIKRMSKFGVLTHRDYLGAIMSLGIKRDKIGDIIVHDNGAQIIVHKDILNYLLVNLRKIGNEAIKVKEIDKKDIDKGLIEYEDIYTTIASLRLDNFISAAINSNRKVSSSLVTDGKVKVNWQPILNTSYQISSGDIISVRGFGRFKLEEINGESKKGRTRIIIRKFK